MSDKLNALLERLKAHQRTLILAMAEHATAIDAEGSLSGGRHVLKIGF